MDNKQIWETNWEQLGRYSIHSAGNRWAFYLIGLVLKNVQLRPGTKVIDCGCGIGAKTALLAERFPGNTVYGIDFSQQGIENSRMYFGDRDNLDFLCIDVHEISNEVSGSIEMITAFELIEHIGDWKSFLGYICEISQKYIVISTPTGQMREYESQLGHYRNFRKGELEEFMKTQGYWPVSVLYAGFPFWSPITRDIYNIMNTSRKHQNSDRGMEVSFNPILHGFTFFLYRYLSFRSIGDQFVGLFEKKENIAIQA